MIVVSHDRAFIARTCTHILEIKDGGAEIYPGTYDEYVWALQHRLQEADETSKKKSRGSGGRDSSTDVVGGSGSYHERKQQESQKRKIEKRMAEIEAAVKASKVRTDKMTAEMSAPGTGDERRRELARGFSAEEASVRQLEDEWLALSEQRDALEKN
jgi:ATP-binding cassette subfamily F protein 3